MKVVVAGSRDLGDELMVINIIKDYEKRFFQITELISGTARGIDSLGELYALIHNIPIKRFPADWNKHGKAAGPIRNIEMAKYCDAGLVMINDASKGAKHMYLSLRQQQKPVAIVGFKDAVEVGRYFFDPGNMKAQRW